MERQLFLWCQNLYVNSQFGLGSALWEFLPEGTRSLFVQPLVQNLDESQSMDGFLLVASTAGYAYSDKDRAWIGSVAEKFRG